MCDFAILTRLVKILCSRFLKFRFKILLARRNATFYAVLQKQRPNARSVRGRQSKNYETQKGDVAKQRECLNRACSKTEARQNYSAAIAAALLQRALL